MSERNPTIERPEASESLARMFRADEFRQPTTSPSTLPDAPFGEMVGFAFKWLLAITIASLFIEVPLGLILYFILQ